MTPPPYPGQTYPGQPFATQPNPGQAYPPPPGAVPGPPVPGQPAKSGNKKILVIGAAVVAVIIVLAVIFALLPKGGAINIPGDNTGPAPASSGAEAVQGYLDALAYGDAAAALSYAEQAPEDTSLLTDEVLAVSNAVAPITEISVTEPANDYSPIAATYQLGDDTVSTEFYASNISGSWKLQDIAREIDTSGMDGVDLTINGAPITGTRLTLFPGSYSVVPTNGNYAVDGGTFVIESPQDYTSHRMELGLSSAGQQKLRSAAQAQLNSCLKQTSLAPKGCGFKIRAAGTGAVKAKWSITSGKNAMKNAKFQLDYSDPTRASAYTSVSLSVKGYSKSGSYVGKGYGSIFKANAVLSTDPITMVFE